MTLGDGVEDNGSGLQPVTVMRYLVQLVSRISPACLAYCFLILFCLTCYGVVW
jgi:hypothetical protein